MERGETRIAGYLLGNLVDVKQTDEELLALAPWFNSIGVTGKVFIVRIFTYSNGGFTGGYVSFEIWRLCMESCIGHREIFLTNHVKG